MCGRDSRINAGIDAEGKCESMLSLFLTLVPASQMETLMALAAGVEGVEGTPVSCITIWHLLNPTLIILPAHTCGIDLGRANLTYGS